MTSRKRPEVKYAPREIFESILEYAVIPTFDLVVELPEGGGVVLVRRAMAPYQNKWALPGLRMFKPESIDDVIARIAEGRTRPGRRCGRQAVPRPVRRPQWGEVPPATGAMYRYYLARYFKHANDPREEPAPR
ncbi:hypothetical protein AB0C74_35525 [Spirillospora sp. NPDC048832]